MKKTVIKLFFSLSVIIFAQGVFAQVVTWTPLYITDEDSVVVIFDATLGSRGLMGYSGVVYAHTGVITSASTQPSDWRHVKTGWGQNTPETKLERIGTDLYRFIIRPSIRAYYNIAPGEQVLQLAFVFRSSTSPFREGKTEGNGDIFIPLRSGLRILSPEGRPHFAWPNDTVTVVAIGSEDTEKMSLFIDGTMIIQVANDTLVFDFIAETYGKKWIKVTAENASTQFAADSFYVVVNGPVESEWLPLGIVDGINYIDDRTVTLSLFAPDKQFVYVMGDFNDWQIDPDYYMKRTPDNDRYWLAITDLEPHREMIFQYLVDGYIYIADPYADKIIDPWNDKWIGEATYPGLIPYPDKENTGIASVLQTAQDPYPWEEIDFERPQVRDLVIYELLLRDFILTHDYKTLTDTLRYLEWLGVNAIELLPINEFEGNSSWGYNPSFYFAPDKYYGPKNDLKKLIEEAHRRGIAVILDVVFNHAYGQCALVRLYPDDMSQSPWFHEQAPHTDFSWGYDFNHQAQPAKDFIDRCLSYWLTEFQVDGFRFDFTRGFTNRNGSSGAFDQSRITILKRIYDHIRSVDSTAYVILEHLVDDNNEMKILAEYGMLLWGNMRYDYQEAAMGYRSNLTWGSYKARGWGVPHLVTYMESHDEERLMYKNQRWGNSSGNYDIQDLNTALDRIKLVSAFFLTIPGPKMIWQFGELGYDYSIDFNGRLGKKPIRWDYYEEDPRKHLYQTIQALIHLKKNYDAFRTSDFAMSAAGSTKRIQLDHESMNVTIIGNFDVVSKSLNPNFQNEGRWYDYFSGDSLTVTDTQSPFTLAPGVFHIYTDVKLEIPDIETHVERRTSIYRPFELHQNYPNPFNQTTAIQYTIEESREVHLDIYNVMGQGIRTLIEIQQPAGAYRVFWNGLHDDGHPAMSGVYMIRFQAGDFVDTRKIVLIR